MAIFDTSSIRKRIDKKRNNVEIKSSEIKKIINLHL